MSAYKEFSGKTVEEALQAPPATSSARSSTTSTSRSSRRAAAASSGMGAEPARIVAAPRQALGGAAPKRDAAAAVPLPRPPAREFDDRPDRGPRRDDRATAAHDATTDRASPPAA